MAAASRVGVLSAHLSGAEPKQSAFVRVTDARFDRCTASFQKKIAAGRIPGCVLLVQKDGKVVYDAALGEADPTLHKPMRRDTIFRLYSMTKPITSLATLLLVEDGKLNVTDAVEKHLPAFKGLRVGVHRTDEQGNLVLDLVDAKRPMQVRDLLTHTSGLAYGFIPDGSTRLVRRAYIKAGIENADMSNAELVAALGKLPLMWQPGEVWEYSRSTDVLGALVERVSGMSLDAFFQSRIFGPLKMVDTGFWVDRSKHERLAQPFAVDPDTNQPITLMDVSVRPKFLSGGGGLAGTAADYLQFLRMMLNHGELDGVRIAKRSTIELMTNDQLNGVRGPLYLPQEVNGFGYGLAVRLADGTDGSKGDYFWGGMAGTIFVNDPKENLIAIGLVQAFNQREEFGALFRKAVYGAIRP